jgi:hypothetical protein
MDNVTNTGIHEKVRSRCQQPYQHLITMDAVSSSSSSALLREQLTQDQENELNHLGSVLDGASEVQVFSRRSNNGNDHEKSGSSSSSSSSSAAVEHSFTVSIIKNKNRLTNAVAASAGSRVNGNNDNHNARSSRQNYHDMTTISNSSPSVVAVAPNAATTSTTRRRREGLLQQLELARGIRQRLEQSYTELHDKFNRRLPAESDHTASSMNHTATAAVAASPTGDGNGAVVFSTTTVIRDCHLAARRVLGERKADLLKLVALTQAMNQNSTHRHNHGHSSNNHGQQQHQHQDQHRHAILNSYDYYTNHLLQEEQEAIAYVHEKQHKFKQSQSNLLKQMYKQVSSSTKSSSKHSSYKHASESQPSSASNDPKSPSRTALAANDDVEMHVAPTTIKASSISSRCNVTPNATSQRAGRGEKHLKLLAAHHIDKRLAEDDESRIVITEPSNAPQSSFPAVEEEKKAVLASTESMDAAAQVKVTLVDGSSIMQTTVPPGPPTAAATTTTTQNDAGTHVDDTAAAAAAGKGFVERSEETPTTASPPKLSLVAQTALPLPTIADYSLAPQEMDTTKDKTTAVHDRQVITETEDSASVYSKLENRATGDDALPVQDSSNSAPSTPVVAAAPEGWASPPRPHSSRTTMSSTNDASWNLMKEQSPAAVGDGPANNSTDSAATDAADNSTATTSTNATTIIITTTTTAIAAADVSYSASTDTNHQESKKRKADEIFNITGDDNYEDADV